MAKATDQLFQVQHTFVTMHEGVELTYLEGEVIHPDDPMLKKMPEHFRPLEFPHDPAAFKAAEPREATADEEKAIVATVKAEADEEEPEPEAEPKPRAFPAHTWFASSLFG